LERRRGERGGPEAFVAMAECMVDAQATPSTAPPSSQEATSIATSEFAVEQDREVRAGPECNEAKRCDRDTCNGRSEPIVPHPGRCNAQDDQEAKAKASPLRAAAVDDEGDAKPMAPDAAGNIHRDETDSTKATADEGALVVDNRYSIMSDLAIAMMLQEQELADAAMDAVERGELPMPGRPVDAWPSEEITSEEMRVGQRFKRLGRRAFMLCCLGWIVVLGVGGYLLHKLVLAELDASIPVDEGPPPWNRTALENITRRALDLTNAYRESKGVPPLRWNNQLAKIGEDHARTIATGLANFSHDGFAGRVHQYPFSYSKAAENLSMCRGHADIALCAVEGWIESPGHERNLRDAELDVCGIGAAIDPVGRYYMTQLFAGL